MVGRRDSWCGISRFYNILGLFPSVEYYDNSCNTLPRVELVTLVLRASEGEMVLVAGMRFLSIGRGLLCDFVRPLV